VRFVGPVAHVNGAKKAMKALGFKDITDTVPWREAFAHWPDEELPGKALAGARHKEGLTQVQLATMTGIPQRHLSEMEHGKRPIGKDTARKLAKALNVHYRIFL
jgi:ribosome-binding protein aMBF1 (putative translation factor)